MLLQAYFYNMDKSVFNIPFQQEDTAGKIVVGLERISEAFRVLLWEHAKVIGLSPIQIQLLIFVAYHDGQFCNVSHLAKEFNLTKPTISDAIKTLLKKGLIKKVDSPTDKRAYSITLTEAGKSMVSDTEHFANPIKKNSLSASEQEQMLIYLSKLIYGLNRAEILTVQRTCYGCRFYEKKTSTHYCNLMKMDLADKDIRLDCPEFEKK